MAQGLAVEGVKHGVSSAVGGGGAAVSLSSLSELERLSTESALVDLALGGTREGKSVVLELEDRVGSLTAPVSKQRLVIILAAVNGSAHM